ncbi:APH(3') family aminoglycoside O-phosphotransferase [Sphingomonas sp. VNH70]|uniref:APH(3') family aminoglycoside O-phosphotransferase n=1 Tax=Sphingomonas silueang TaxID=3156617 RepID=UPI0032B5CF02
MDERETGCAPPTVPDALAGLVAGYRWSRNLVGEAGGAVYRLHGAAGRTDLYLKHGQGDIADDVLAEVARLRWFAGRVAVPAITGFVWQADDAWLLTAALPGETARQRLVAAPRQAGAIADALAVFLAQLHALPVEDCPFVADHLHRMVEARRRIDAGLVDTDDFDHARAGWSAEAVWDAMQALLPLTPDRLVTHGDFSLDNILIDGERVVGCIDVGRAGVADRYQDLAILAGSLEEYGAALPARMFARYGIAMPDPRRLAFHALLDELF